MSTHSHNLTKFDTCSDCIVITVYKSELYPGYRS